MRRLDAEVLADALDRIGGPSPLYQSPIPEPFTFVPRDRRTVQLEDGSITSEFLNLFGRPSRDRGLEEERSREPSAFQSMYFLNATDIHTRVRSATALRGTMQRSPAETVRRIYRQVLSREPSRAEIEQALAFLRAHRPAREAAEDLLWALINSTEFVYQH